jgi:hypothetical protein
MLPYLEYCIVSDLNTGILPGVLHRLHCIVAGERDEAQPVCQELYRYRK